MKELISPIISLNESNIKSHAKKEIPENFHTETTTPIYHSILKCFLNLKVVSF